MELGLQQSQNLGLVMTTELRQAISLLKYSTYELYQYLKEQEIENPLIELKESSYEQRYTAKFKNSSSTIDNPIEQITVKEEEDIREHLLSQTQILQINKEERKILQYLILNLDENGYLSITNEEASNQLNVDINSVSKAVNILHQLDPIGVGARDLKECLMIQAKYYYPEEKEVFELIENHLERIANKKWHDIAKSMDISLVKVKELIDLIQTLNPKPCSMYSNNKTEYLIPDIIVEYKDEKYIVYLNEGYLPEMHVNQQYKLLLNNSNSKEAQFLKNHYDNYRWIQRSIEKRRTTILNIARTIVEKQQNFFKYGFDALKPMTLKEIADEINMHESTVSRATINKVIQTPIGSFDLRKLFTSKINTTSGSVTSKVKVTLLIEELVKKENKFKPFSDQQITELLKIQYGITISRRTVAKYREQLNIPSSSKRKEIKI